MNDGEVVHCSRCGRKLKNLVSIERGIGKVCQRKERAEIARAAFIKKQLVLNFD